MNMTIGLGQRPRINMKFVFDNGKEFDFGPQVEGDDWVAKFYNWLHRRKVQKYIRYRLRYETGDRLEEFRAEVNRNREARRGC